MNPINLEENRGEAAAIKDNQDRPQSPGRASQALLREKQEIEAKAATLTREIREEHLATQEVLLRVRDRQSRRGGARVRQNLCAPTAGMVAAAGTDSTSELAKAGKASLCGCILALAPNKEFKEALDRRDYRKVIGMVCTAATSSYLAGGAARLLSKGILTTSLLELLQKAAPIEGGWPAYVVASFLIQVCFLVFAFGKRSSRRTKADKLEFLKTCGQSVMCAFFAILLPAAQSVTLTACVLATAERMKTAYDKSTGNPLKRIFQGIFFGSFRTISDFAQFCQSALIFTGKLALDTTKFCMQLPLKVWDNGPLEGLDKALENFASQDQRTLAKMNAAIRRLDGEDGPRPVTATDLVYEKQDQEQIHAAFWCPILSNLVFDPVMVHGHVFERAELESYFRIRANLGWAPHPNTRHPFAELDMQPPPAEYQRLHLRYVETLAKLQALAASDKVLSRLLEIQTESEVIEGELTELQIAINKQTPPELASRRGKLAQLHGKLGKLLEAKIDAISTDGLQSGREAVRAKRKQLVKKSMRMQDQVEAVIKEIDGMLRKIRKEGETVARNLESLDIYKD